jgi:hypothetical protein
MRTPHFGVPVGTDDEVRVAIRADIEKRLRGSCSSWTEEDFQKLVDKMTTTAMKYVYLPHPKDGRHY